MPTTGKFYQLYVHIPFCHKRCPYCHFYVTHSDTARQEAFTDGILQEFDRIKSHLIDRSQRSLYLGGGTPSQLSLIQLERLITSLPHAGEVTLEANPNDITKEFVQGLANMGINRLSLGVQSLDDQELALLGREHTAKGALVAIETAAQAISNLSIDLMYDLPSQTPYSFQKTLSYLPSLPITHLSLYNLTIEPNTPFFRRRGKLNLPQEQASVEMLQAGITAIEGAGLKRYEISAFAKPGLQAVHNTGYWMGFPFFGLGPSAFSYWEGRRFQNTPDLKKYLNCLRQGESAIDFSEQLTDNESIKELIAIRLRLLEGISLEDFLFPQETLETLEKLIDAGLLERENRRIRLSTNGLLFYDSVAQELI